MTPVADILEKLALLDSEVDLDDWRSVQQAVVSEYSRLAPLAKEARQEHPSAGQLWVSRRSGLVLVDQEPESLDDWYLIKAAGAWLEPVRKVVSGVQNPFGGPRPLTSTIVGGLLLAAPGALVGTALGWKRPRKTRRRLQKTWAALGAGAGMLPGLGWGLVNMANRDRIGTGRMGAWISKWPFEKKSSDVGSARGAGSLFLPSIPVDSFNRAVWNDVVVGRSPFGTRSRFGTNEAPMKTPPPVAAAVTGVLSGASAAKGGTKMVSPWDVARTTAITGAKGWLGGLVLGKTLGALAGVKPETQKKLQRIGVWGGILTGAAQQAFFPSQ